VKNYQDHTLKEYTRALSSKTPVPGGGSAAALVASLGMALIAMVARYSIDRNPSQAVERKTKSILRQGEALEKRLLQLVDRDAQAYRKVVKTRWAPPAKKKAALREARRVPQEVVRSCQRGIPLAAFLVKKGNRYLQSDARLAIEFLKSALRASQITIEINQ